MRLLLLLFPLLLMAQTKQINYEATFGIFGKVGELRNQLVTQGNRYTIETHVKLMGIAKLLLDEPKEHYTSKGHIYKGRLLSDTMRLESIKGDKKSIKLYKIDRAHHRLYRTKWRYEKGKLVYKKSSYERFYGEDDLLTLYFNMPYYAHRYSRKGAVVLGVAGLDKQKGKVQIDFATKQNLNSYYRKMGSASWYAKAHITQRNFRKKKGNIVLSGGKDGYVDSALIEDILLYGDAKLKRLAK